jgi:hypothetical protein
MSKQLNEIMAKEMSRKQFVAILGSACLSIFGLSAILDILSGSSKVQPSSKYGYGSGPYGGTKDKLPPLQ